MQVKALWWKLVILAGVTLVLMIALLRIGWLVDERQQRQRAAEAGVAAAQAGPQVLLGPVVQRSCTEEWDGIGGGGKEPLKPVTERRDFILSALPSELTVDGTLNQEPRRRGLFKVNAYAGQVGLQARWSNLAALTPPAPRNAGRIQCDAPRVVVAVSDSRGLRQVTVKRGEAALVVRPGTRNDSYPRGLHAVLPAHALDEPLALSVAVDLIGMTDFGVVPAAAATQVTLRSDWPHPSFGGRFLPATSTVGPKGFEATWKVSELATTALRDVAAGRGLPAIDRDPEAGGYPMAPVSDAKNAQIADTLAFSMIDPVNPYVMSDRAIKYGLMFIVLTFVSVGLLELLSGRRVHPVQYLLVGLAMTLFFLLLLSLSEHLSFPLSYGLAAASAIGLLAFYGASMLGSARRGLGFGALVTVLYAALFVLLNLEKAALLVGAVLLFAVLAAVMALTRRIDWYAPGGRTADLPQAELAGTR
ncbi:cell envelope integrity protein CreD [Mitsuaria sp. GD03876]|uniref:cell envelope integrity protein CreD n=1 Tax=Mitsuaria sp. GD03876 TaxID=2975399 RepID=UPI0024486434|nr:cell envelope integrity protein CreD [Mitsuaria sp. GD03876]MDH0867430.1 cell envelope integrity protein CreD [Mitsuaria sp. GD03876]